MIEGRGEWMGAVDSGIQAIWGEFLGFRMNRFGGSGKTKKRRGVEGEAGLCFILLD